MIWLKEALSFIPNIEEDNWKFLRHALRDKTSNELPNKGSIAILVQNILNSIAQRDLVFYTKSAANPKSANS